MEPVQLNVREGTKLYAYFSCRPTPAHYRETGRKLVQDQLDQRIIKRCGDSRSKWCALTHFVEKPGRVPLALHHVVDFNWLNERLIRNQPQVFPMGEEIRKQLGADLQGVKQHTIPRPKQGGGGDKVSNSRNPKRAENLDETVQPVESLRASSGR